MASAEDGDLVLDNRSEDGQHRDDRAAGLRRRGRPPSTAFEDGDVDWAQVPPSSYEQAVEEYGDDAFAPFQAELFFGMNVATPALSTQVVRQAIMLAIDRDAIVEAVYPDLADPLATVVPGWRPGPRPGPLPGLHPRPRPGGRHHLLLVPGGRVPTVHLDFDETPAQKEMADLVADRPRGGRHPHRAAAPAARRVRGIRRVGQPGALQLRVDRRLRVARCLPRSAVRVVGQRQPHRLPGRPRGRSARGRPGQRQHRREREAVGPSRGGDPRGRRRRARSPSSAPRWSSPTVWRASTPRSTAPSTGPR